MHLIYAHKVKITTATVDTEIEKTLRSLKKVKLVEKAVKIEQEGTN